MERAAWQAELCTQDGVDCSIYDLRTDSFMDLTEYMLE